MANFIAYLNARTISTRFHIRVATVKAVHVMWGPTGINLRVGSEPLHEPDQGPHKEGEGAEGHTYVIVLAHLPLRIRAAPRPSVWPIDRPERRPTNRAWARDRRDHVRPAIPNEFQTIAA